MSSNLMTQLKIIFAYSTKLCTSGLYFQSVFPLQIYITSFHTLTVQYNSLGSFLLSEYKSAEYM